MTTKTKVSCKFRYFKLAKTLSNSKMFGFFTGNDINKKNDCLDYQDSR